MFLILHVHSNDEDENERVSKNNSGDHGIAASEEEPILVWDLHAVANICNVNGQFIVPAVFPDSFPIMTKKGVLALSRMASFSYEMAREKIW